MTPDNDLDATGRAVGLALTTVLQFMHANKRAPTADELGDLLESFVYDRQLLTPKTMAVVKGMLEGISVASHGSPDATL